MELSNKLLQLIKENFKVFEIVALIIIMISAAVFLYLKGSANTVTVEEAVSSEKETLTSDAGSKAASGSRALYVDISGEVMSPGVYEMPADSRVFEVIEKAGGLTKKADVTNVNRAENIKDGQKIVIPRKGERQDQMPSGTASQSSSSGSLININTDDNEKLQEIPGVGEVTAQKIIDYRNENGAFSKIEDIKNVSGIGDKTFEKMKDKISV